MRTSIAGPMLVGLVLAQAACRGGDDGVEPIDARPVDALYADCGYREALLGDEDEVTGLTLGAAEVSVCGTIAMVTPTTDGLLEIDSYLLTVGQPGLYRFRIEALDAQGTPTESTTDDVQVLGAQIGTGTTRDHGLFVDDQGLFLAELPAGQALLWVYAFGSIRPMHETAYRVTAVADAPGPGCPPAPGAPDYVESHDGADHRGNDVHDVNSSTSAPVTSTARGDDVAEPTGLTIGADQVRKLAGVSADVPPVGPSLYRDRDAFAVTTGPSTHVLDLDLTWTGGNTNLDLLAIEPPAGWILGLVTGGARTGPVVATMSVRPSTTYLFWVGAVHDAGAVLPVSYELTVCGH